MLELVLVIMIISLLIVIAVDRLLILKVEAERTAMQSVLGSLRSAMTIQVAARIARDKVDELPAMAGSNPMDWLSTQPENYIGVKDEPDPADIKGYQWYFDSYNRQLVYRVGNREYFKSPLAGAPRARFQVNLDYTDNNNDGRFSPRTDEIHGLTLQSVEPYEWLAEPVNIEDYVSPNAE